MNGLTVQFAFRRETVNAAHEITRTRIQLDNRNTIFHQPTTPGSFQSLEFKQIIIPAIFNTCFDCLRIVTSLWTPTPCCVLMTTLIIRHLFQLKMTNRHYSKRRLRLYKPRVSNKVLRDFAAYLCQPLAAIFNASVREGFIPPIWKSADVTQYPKYAAHVLLTLTWDHSLCCRL